MLFFRFRDSSLDIFIIRPLDYRDRTQVCLHISTRRRQSFPVLTYPRIYVPCIYVYSVFTEVRKPRLHVQEKYS